MSPWTTFEPLARKLTRQRHVRGSSKWMALKKHATFNGNRRRIHFNKRKSRTHQTKEKHVPGPLVGPYRKLATHLVKSPVAPTADRLTGEPSYLSWGVRGKSNVIEHRYPRNSICLPPYRFGRFGTADKHIYYTKFLKHFFFFLITFKYTN